MTVSAPSLPLPSRPAGWIARTAATAVLTLAAVLVLLDQSGYRGWEAWSAGHATAWVTAMPAYIYRSTFFVDVGAPDIFGLRVTGECTSAIIIVGILGLTALLTLTTRLPLRRLGLATLLSAGSFYLLNLARLVGIALATRQWGLDTGYYWSHIWAGGFVTIIGVAGVLALYLMVLGRIRRRHTTTGGAT